MGTVDFVYRAKPRVICDVFFPCTETLNPDGSGAMVDRIRGATWRPSRDGAQFTLTNGDTPSNSVYSISNQVNPATLLDAGTWPNFKLRPILLFACGRIIDPTQVKAPIGTGVVSLSNAGGMHAVVYSGVPGSGSSIVVTPSYPEKVLPPVGTDIGLILEYIPKGVTTARFVDLSGNTFNSGAAETRIEYQTPFSSDDEINPGLVNHSRIGGCAWYSIAAFSFPDGSIPSNKEEVIQWMLCKHPDGDRELPHQWSYSTA